MKLGTKAIYALLFVLYLGRAGRAQVSQAAEGMKISHSFLEQIARKLRIAGIVKSIRGPGGGYELSGDTSIAAVLNAVGVSPLITPTETRKLSIGCAEERQLAEIIGGISFNLKGALNQSVVQVGRLVDKREGTQLASLNEASTVN